MPKRILEMKNITKKFPGVVALKDVTFDAMEGEILALVGENGAGKSTLMKILSGSYPHYSYDGSIYIDGKKVEFANPRQSEEAGIAMIYQEINMHLDLSVAENLFLGRWPKNGSNLVAWGSMFIEAKKYIDLVQLEVNPREILRNLSTSQQQLISIARALSKEPKILVLDEPTSALTKKESENLFEIMHQLKVKGITSILISHKLDEVFQNADRVTVLRDGQIIATHNRADVDVQDIVAEMVGRKMSALYPKEKVDIGEEVLKIDGFTVPHPFTGEKNIVEEVSFELKRGEILGIAGLVGAGRSELVNAIFGKIKRKKGNVLICGKEVKIKKPADAIANGIALVTEDRKVDGFVSVLSIKHNSTLAYLKKISRYGVIKDKDEKENANYFFKALNVRAPGINTLMQTLSGGNQQKVVLSKWLMRKPQILIMDEPTRGIDVGAKYEIYKIMVDLVKKGISIIMISSELPELISMSDRVLVLSNGKIKGEFIASECTQEQIMHLAAGAGDVETLNEKTCSI